jgi:hypothetical protein
MPFRSYDKKALFSSELQEVVTLFRALAHPARLAILKFLFLNPGKVESLEQTLKDFVSALDKQCIQKC